MKRNPIWPVLALLVAVILNLSGCKSGDGEEDANPETEVAVQVGKVVKAQLRARVEAYGAVEPEPAMGGLPGGGARLEAPAAGLVLAVVATEGQQVKAGDLIVRLDDRVGLAAVDKAKYALAFAEQVVARQEKLKAVEGTSEKAIQEAQQQLAAAKAELASVQASLALVQLTSPLDGVVTHLNVQPGQTVDQNTVVAEIVDLGRLVVTANVPASEAAVLKTGQPAEVLAESASGAPVSGKVLFVSPQVDAKTGTVLFRVTVPRDSGLLPGQFVRVRVVTEERAGRLAVPRESVYTDHDGRSTLSIVEGDTAIQKTVKVGLRDGELVEVEGEGIAEGVTVVTVGSYALPQETKIRIVSRQDR